MINEYIWYANVHLQHYIGAVLNENKSGILFQFSMVALCLLKAREKPYTVIHFNPPHKDRWCQLYVACVFCRDRYRYVTYVSSLRMSDGQLWVQECAVRFTKKMESSDWFFGRPLQHFRFLEFFYCFVVRRSVVWISSMTCVDIEVP